MSIIDKLAEPDLVKRLRLAVNIIKGDYPVSALAIEEAIAEIEILRTNEAAAHSGAEILVFRGHRT